MKLFLTSDFLLTHTEGAVVKSLDLGPRRQHKKLKKLAQEAKEATLLNPYFLQWAEHRVGGVEGRSGWCKCAKRSSRIFRDRLGSRFNTGLRRGHAFTTGD